MYSTDVEVYRVTDDEELSKLHDADADWFEYRVYLLRDGCIVGKYDSYAESYNGVQRLSKKTACDAANEIVKDVQAGNASEWFVIFLRRFNDQFNQRNNNRRWCSL